jgi:hypothetical protein
MELIDSQGNELNDVGVGIFHKHLENALRVGFRLENFYFFKDFWESALNDSQMNRFRSFSFF